MIKVVKFGGSSLASAVQFKKVRAIIDSDRSRNFVIPSAPGKRNDGDTKVTDMLYKYYDLVCLGEDGSKIRERIQKRFQEIIDGLKLDFNINPEFEKMEQNFKQGYGRDYAASRGEYLNGMIMSRYLKIPFIDAADVICFDRNGNFLPEKTNTFLQNVLLPIKRAVIPGFYGSMPDGKIKTFSRGGSDITGSLVARAVMADLYENWTDVSGFLLADPRIVENPVPISTITYKELYELSAMGASVLHEDAVFPVKQAGIPINIKNTNHPEDEGTMIVNSTEVKPSYKITGIAGKKGFCAVNICKGVLNWENEYAGKVLDVLTENEVPFKYVPSEEEEKMSILVDQKTFQEKEAFIIPKIYDLIHPESVSLESDLALVAVGRRGFHSGKRIEGRVFSALENAKINVRTVESRSEEQSMLIGVYTKDFELAVRTIYNNFIKAAVV